MKRTLLIAPLVFSLACRPTVEEPATAHSLARETAAYLWNQQGADGGWHSPTHGIATGGESWTPFILFHLLQVPDSIYVPGTDAINSGLDFVRSRISESGVIGHGDPMVSDYPNYAAAYAIGLLMNSGSEADRETVGRLTAYLRSQQIAEQRGFDPSHVAYGGWGFGEQNLPQGSPGHVDLSHTRRVIEALQRSGVDDSVFRKAQIFLRRVQKLDGETAERQTGYDGGFFASTVVPGVNKGGTNEGQGFAVPFFRSYATATSDGILALRAAGVTSSDARVNDALEWLWQHPDLEIPAGIPADSPIPWDRVMFYYHLYSRAEVYSLYGGPQGWKSDIVKLLASRQRADGSFANPAGSPNKEDDPLIASTFALHALLRTLGS